MDVRKKIQEERRHYQTGMLTIEIPISMRTIPEAKEYSLDLIWKLRILLSFAHRHDVPIHELMLYEVSDSQEDLREHEIGVIWVGKPGASSLNVRYGLDKFLATAMPLISLSDFISRTNALLAISYYNLAMNLDFTEVKFLLWWLGLEAMANAHYENNQQDMVLTRDEWNALKDQCRQFLVEIGKEAVFSDLLARVSFLREGTIKERIDYMLRNPAYHMEQYSEEVASVYEKMRVPLFHGREIDWISDTTLFEKAHRVERLLEKLILKTLAFYDNNMIYHAIKEDDLSAR